MNRSNAQHVRLVSGINFINLPCYNYACVVRARRPKIKLLKLDSAC